MHVVGALGAGIEGLACGERSGSPSSGAGRAGAPCGASTQNGVSLRATCFGAPPTPA